MPGPLIWFAAHSPIVMVTGPLTKPPGGAIVIGDAAAEPRGNGRCAYGVWFMKSKEDEMDAIPATIHEGMTVYDSAMQVIGTVETFRGTDEAPGRPEVDAAGVSPVLEERRNDLVGILAEVFRPDDELPHEMQEKALREGFVRLDADGLFAADRYIFPQHIDRVEGDRLVLSVRREDLLKA